MFNKLPKTLTRFLKYSFVGTSTFALDLVILTVLVEIFSLPSVWSAGIGFLVAISINYYLSRKYVFKGTLRGVHSGYVHFLVIGAVGLMFVMGSMYILTVLFHYNYLIVRIIIGIITGFWNYLLNLYVNFQVAGKHELP